MPHTAAQIFWRSEHGDRALVVEAPPKPRSYLSLLLEVVLTFLLPLVLVLLAVAFAGKKRMFYLPGKPQP